MTAEAAGNRLFRKMAPLSFCLVVGAAMFCPLSLAQETDAETDIRAVYNARCSFIESEATTISAVVEGNADPTRDKFLRKWENGTTIYLYAGRLLEAIYVLTSDGRKMVIEFDMSKEFLAQNNYSERYLALRLHVPLPLPQRLLIQCDEIDLVVSKHDENISSMKVTYNHVE